MLNTSPAKVAASVPLAEAEKTEFKNTTVRELTRATKAAIESSDPRQNRTVALDAARIVIFSDHHRGVGDGADDHRFCAAHYAAALAYYYEKGFDLILLGDVEELWERDWSDVEPYYKAILQKELSFAQAGKLWRVYGNHDDQWSADSSRLSQYLAGGKVYEALCINFADGDKTTGRLLLLHGHQGKDYAKWKVWAVRNVWGTFQSILGIGSTLPSRNYEMRNEHERNYHEWVRDQNTNPAIPPTALVAGHTHHAIFGSYTHEMCLQARLNDLRDQVKNAPAGETETWREEAAKVAAQLAYTRAANGAHAEPISLAAPPVYFNSGCCAFWDGDVTAIEISGAEIKLVRFPNDEGEQLPEILRRAPLRTIFSRITQQAPLPPVEDAGPAVTIRSLSHQPAATPSIRTSP